MKKILSLFGAFIVVLTSCTNDDSEEKSLLPKTQIYTNASQPLENNSITYSYDANKIVDYTYDDGSKVVFTYTGDL
jgi:hypothetical protein